MKPFFCTYKLTLAINISLLQYVNETLAIRIKALYASLKKQAGIVVRKNTVA